MGVVSKAECDEAEYGIVFSYTFTYSEDSQRRVTLRVVLDPQTLRVREPVHHLPDWARLDYHQCSVCPLDKAVHPWCPAAMSLVDLVETFRDLLSYTEVEVLVVTQQRTMFRRTTVQKALSSLVGLYMATSGCPVLGKLKPMARFHLPFATRDETIFRAVGTYFMAQYFLRKKGRPFDQDLSGLRAIYDEVHAVNLDMTRRLRRVSAGDASVNAIVLLDLFAQELPTSIQENLSDLQHLFTGFFEEY
jgi:hypothetical protein